MDIYFLPQCLHRGGDAGERNGLWDSLLHQADYQRYPYLHPVPSMLPMLKGERSSLRKEYQILAGPITKTGLVIILPSELRALACQVCGFARRENLAGRRMRLGLGFCLCSKLLVLAYGALMTLLAERGMPGGTLISSRLQLLLHTAFFFLGRTQQNMPQLQYGDGTSFLGDQPMISLLVMRQFFSIGQEGLAVLRH